MMEAHVSTLISKKPFFPYVVHVHQPPLASTEDLLWLPTELAAPGEAAVTTSQRLCTVVPAPDHPLFPCLTPMAVSPGQNLHLSAMCICRICSFHPTYLPCAFLSTACSVPEPKADFCPLRPEPIEPGSGAGPGQVVHHSPSQPQRGARAQQQPTTTLIIRLPNLEK